MWRGRVAHPMTVQTVMALAVAGSALGLYLGKSAIGEINPAYFSTPLPGSRFHADMVPNQPDRNRGWGADIEQASFQPAPVYSCIGCRTYPEEYVPVPDPAIEGYAVTYADYDPVPAVEIIEDVEREIEAVAARAADVQQVVRYAHYPVSADEAKAKPVQVAAGAAPVAETASEEVAPGT